MLAVPASQNSPSGQKLLEPFKHRNGAKDLASQRETPLKKPGGATHNVAWPSQTPRGVHSLWADRTDVSFLVPFVEDDSVSKTLSQQTPTISFPSLFSVSILIKLLVDCPPPIPRFSLMNCCPDLAIWAAGHSFANLHSCCNLHESARASEGVGEAMRLDAIRSPPRTDATALRLF